MLPMDVLRKELEEYYSLYVRADEDFIGRIVLIQNDYTFDTFKEERALLSATLEDTRLGKFNNNPQGIRGVLDSVRNHTHIIRAAEGNPVIPDLKPTPGILHITILNRLRDFDDRDIDELDNHGYTEMMSLATLADIADKSLSQETDYNSCLFCQNDDSMFDSMIRTPLQLLLNIGFQVKLFPDGTFITDGNAYVKVRKSVIYGKRIVLHVHPVQYASSQINNLGLELGIPDDHYVEVMGNVSSETIARWVTRENNQSSMNTRGRMARNLCSDRAWWLKNQCGPMVYGYQKLSLRGRTLQQTVSYLEVQSGQILDKSAHAKVTWLRGVRVSTSPEVFWSSEREWTQAAPVRTCTLGTVQKIISQELHIPMANAEDYASFFLLANNWFNPNAGSVRRNNGCAYLHKDEAGVEVKPVSWRVCEAIGWSYDSSGDKIYSPHNEEYSVIRWTSHDQRGHFDLENKRALVPHKVDSTMMFAGNSKY